MRIKSILSKFLVGTLVITTVMGGRVASAKEKKEEVISPSNVVYFDAKEEDERIQAEIMRQSEKSRADGEVWTLASTETVKENVLLTAKADGMVPKDAAKRNTIGLSLGANKTIYGIKVNVGFTYSHDYTISGPKGSSPLANDKKNGYLTHNVAVGYTKGNLIKYTYKVTNKYSGGFLRTETSVAAERKESSYYTIGVQSASKFKAENTAGNKFKTYANYSDYAEKVAALNSSYLWW
ncbi:hypothetical protein [Clostridium sp. LP20]|uniref:hypothetical protein n=1 Tax=Clostridium sp. LP20 TaxID=3418665 RepID=UPI003EE7A5CB